MAASDGDGAKKYGATGEIDQGFIRRTYRSTLLWAIVVVLYLSAYGHGRLVLPFALGVGVGLGGLYGIEVLVGAAFTPLRAQARNKKTDKPRIPRRIIAQVTIKYLSAILLLWYIARHWDLVSIAVFIGGVCLVQVSIVTRTLSRVVLAGWEQDKTG